MLEEETEQDVAYATGHLLGRRVVHYWTPSHSPASALEHPLGLEEGERAWDTYLLYPPGTRWEDEVPEPSYYMHVAKSLPDDRRLNGKKLAAEVGKLLGAD